MTDRLTKLRSSILARLPQSRLTPLTEAGLRPVLGRYPDLPDHLRELFTVVGVGTIGDGRYMIHGTLDPLDVFDVETARGLEGIVLVGDDFAGTFEAYDARRGWRFGTVDSSCEFCEKGPRQSRNFLEFLESRYGDTSSA
jgi:hypothetical protein